ncbi:MAG: Lrp/AsnC family transcriptional regulator [Akkermansia sp.]
MTNDPLLQLLSTQARLTDKELSERLSITEQEATEQRLALERNGHIVGYQAIINDGEEHDIGVSAFIEVKVTPEREGGFDRLATRIARFDEVSSCYLASGGFDLLVIIEGKDIREIANFVSEKLSTLDGILSTSTHFHLKTYKKNGCLFDIPTQDERLIVSP